MAVSKHATTAFVTSKSVLMLVKGKSIFNLFPYICFPYLNLFNLTTQKQQLKCALERKRS